MMKLIDARRDVFLASATQSQLKTFSLLQHFLLQQKIGVPQYAREMCQNLVNDLKNKVDILNENEYRMQYINLTKKIIQDKFN